MSVTRINAEKVEYINGWRVTYRADGLVEVCKDFTRSNMQWSQWGTLYSCLVTSGEAYPVSFRSRPYTRVEPYYHSAAIVGYDIEPVTNPVTTMPPVYAIRPGANNGMEVRIGFFATGWLA